MSNKNTFSYKDYLALVLIYTANASDGINQKEYEAIISKVGDEHYQNAIDFFDKSSEVEIIETIDELSDEYARDRMEEVCADVKDIISADDIDTEIEEQILRMLRKLIV